MRLDRLLCYLRFARTRSRAQALIGEGHVRVNGVRVTRASCEVVPGDVVTWPAGRTVRVARIVSLPDRRGGPSEAARHYEPLDP